MKTTKFFRDNLKLFIPNLEHFYYYLGEYKKYHSNIDYISKKQKFLSIMEKEHENLDEYKNKCLSIAKRNIYSGIAMKKIWDFSFEKAIISKETLEKYKKTFEPEKYYFRISYKDIYFDVFGSFNYLHLDFSREWFLQNLKINLFFDDDLFFEEIFDFADKKRMLAIKKDHIEKFVSIVSKNPKFYSYTDSEIYFDVNTLEEIEELKKSLGFLKITNFLRFPIKYDVIYYEKIVDENFLVISFFDHQNLTFDRETLITKYKDDKKYFQYYKKYIIREKLSKWDLL